MKHTFGSLKKKERGQSLVELGISLPFLLTLMAVVIELGWVLFLMISMRDSVQEGASFAALCQNTKMIVSRMQDSATAPLDIKDIEDYKIEYLDSSGNVNGLISYGYTVRATLTMQHKIIVPFVGSFIGDKGTVPLTVRATDTIMQLDTVCTP
jgi:Flp pilus assembly protein TadG